MRELNIKIASMDTTIFLQDGFFVPRYRTVHFHKHYYTEIHVIAGGNATFRIGKELHTFNAGDVFAIPPGVYHYCVSANENIYRTAFQIKENVENFAVIHFGERILKDFVENISIQDPDGDYCALVPYFSFICTPLFKLPSVKCSTNTDYSFILYEFFSTCYPNNVKLCDLADILHLSEKQTQRVVQKYTGNTFKEELVKRRMEMACHLMEATSMPKERIAVTVGYNSYSGFWKAVQKYPQYKSFFER